MPGKRVAVGMSGGVDSSVCALLLKEAGYEVIGATMRILPDACGQCARKLGKQRQQEQGGQQEQLYEQDFTGFSLAEADARRVARYLGIEHHVVDLRETFQRDVIDHFTGEYLAGRTPNPCIVCNRRLKWGAFYEVCKGLGADLFATGHYARICRLPDGRYTLQNALYSAKDQTYVLYTLSQEDLARTLMPLGTFEKAQVRAIAAQAGLPVAEKKDSQDICFIPDGDYAAFLKRETGSLGKSGHFVLEEPAGVVKVSKEPCSGVNRPEAETGARENGPEAGTGARENGPETGTGARENGPEAAAGTQNQVVRRIVGRHSGAAQFTIGQRKGLGVAVGRPVYVCRIDAQSGDIYLGDHDRLMKNSLVAADLCYMGEAHFDEAKRYRARTRYSQKSSFCRVRYLDSDRIRVDFEEPVRAVTPGQSLVLYTDDWIAGGGVIEG